MVIDPIVSFVVFELNIMLTAGRIENLKKIADIINNFLKIKTDIQLCIDFDPSCNNFWMYHYKTSWIDHFGECRWKYLKNYIDTYNICFIDK